MNYDEILKFIQKNFTDKKEGEFDDFYFIGPITFMITHVRGEAKYCGVSEEIFKTTQILIFARDSEPVVIAEKTKD